MKKIIFLLFVISALTDSFLIVNAQWIQQPTGTTANLYDIEFLNRYTGWSVGDGGTCLKTTNGGINWVQMNHPVGGKNLMSVHIVDSNVIYIVGYFRTIIKTTDGGSSWIIIENGPGGGGRSYFGLYFINKDTGWVSGSSSKISKTTNGGLSFDSVIVSASYTYDMYFRDAFTGFASGEGKILKTTNGGSNWFYSLQLTGTRIFWKISFVDNQYGWVAGYNGAGVYRTNNFGQNWSLIYDSANIVGMFGVCFINKDTGFVGGNVNKLFKTTDGGYSWARENTPINNHTFESIEFVNDTIGWTCSTSGQILFTTTGGQTLTGIANQGENTADNYELYQNYPNPYNNQTKIKFDIPMKEVGQTFLSVTLKVYDISGREIQTLVNEQLNPGTYEVTFDGSNFASGIYFYQLSVGDFVDTKKLILLK